MRMTLKSVYSVLLQWNQGYFEASVWKGHPTQKNLYSLLHIGKVGPMAVSEATVPKWQWLEVMIVPVWNVLKWCVLSSFQTQWEAFCAPENVTDCRPHNGFVIRGHLSGESLCSDGFQVGAIMDDTYSSSDPFSNLGSHSSLCNKELWGCFCDLCLI